MTFYLFFKILGRKRGRLLRLRTLLWSHVGKFRRRTSVCISYCRNENVFERNVCGVENGFDRIVEQSEICLNAFFAQFRRKLVQNF